MDTYPELLQAIEAVLGKADESEEFKRRLRKLILNVFANNEYLDTDVKSIVDHAKAEPKEG